MCGMAGYRTFDNVGRGQAACRSRATHTTTNSNYQAWQSELPVNGKSFDTAWQWTRALLLHETSPTDGGFLYQVHAVCRRPPPPNDRPSSQNHRREPQKRVKTAPTRLTPEATTASGRIPASTPASRYTLCARMPLYAGSRSRTRPTRPDTNA